MLISTKGWPAFAFSESSAWGRCLESFLSTTVERSGSRHTLIKYRSILALFFAGTWAKMPDRYVRSEVEAFLRSPGQANGREGLPPGPGTINNRLACLRSFYTYAANYAIVGQDGRNYPLLASLAPTANIRGLQAPRNYKALSTEEIQRFFAAIPVDTEQGLRDRALYTTLLYTARRISECLALRYGDLVQTTIEDNGTTSEIWTFSFFGKGKKRIQDTQELPLPAYQAIQAYLIGSGRAQHMDPGTPLFVAGSYYRKRIKSYDPDLPLSQQAVWRSLQHYALASGLSKKIHAHVFRHTSARIRFLSGSKLQDIQRVLRHSNISTTDRYISALTTMQDPGARLLSVAFGNL